MTPNAGLDVAEMFIEVRTEAPNPPRRATYVNCCLPSIMKPVAIYEVQTLVQEVVGSWFVCGKVLHKCQQNNKAENMVKTDLKNQYLF